MLIPHKGHTDTIQVYSVTVMTHVKALQAGHSSQGTSEPITPGFDVLHVAIVLYLLCSCSGHFSKRFTYLSYLQIHVTKIRIILRSTCYEGTLYALYACFTVYGYMCHFFNVCSII